MPCIRSDRRDLTVRFIPDQQREIGCDRDALGLAMLFRVEMAAAQHPSRAIHFGVGVLWPRDQDVRPADRMACDGGAVEVARAGDPFEVP
jgi:hypothetical protein